MAQLFPDGPLGDRERTKRFVLSRAAGDTLTTDIGRVGSGAMSGGN